ncbi:polysaccharide biosynthesis/export family protein [uncultured Aquincola sp.]|uniref:polysaccharide biosynthesis/export family protein n=1 Tax=uncultured Aquincola sp. TaxID=886556 RepID=UPI0032B263B2
MSARIPSIVRAAGVLQAAARAVLLSALLSALLGAGLAGCASRVPSFVSSPLPGPQEEGPLPLAVGDLIEVDYYPTATIAPQAYRIGVDDRLRVEVADHANLLTDQALVLPDGSVSVAGVGSVAAAGRTIDEVAADVTAGLRRAYIRNPRVVVSVQLGDGRLRSLINRRSDNGGTELNLFQIAEGGQLLLPFIAPVDALRPIEAVRQDVVQAYRRAFGDRLEITVKLRQARQRLVYVMGEVVKPGVVEYTPQLTTLSAVAAAGGLLSSAESTSVVLYRQRPEGRRAWLLNLRDTLTDAREDAQRIAVRPDDVVYVPKSGVALANDAVDQYVRRMLPLPANIGVSVNVR